MEKPCLNDENEFPDNDVLSRHLGQAQKPWDAFMALLKEDHPSFFGEWRYYRDGKSWLFKVARKKTTICWVSVFKAKFKTGFYFGGKAEDLIVNSKLRKEYKVQFLEGKRHGKIRSITVVVKKMADLASTQKLIAIKEQIK